MPACVRKPFLDDAENLDLFVRRQLNRGVDVELDLESAVCGEEVDVASERSVERGATRRRRECEHGEARFLLRGELQPP